MRKYQKIKNFLEVNKEGIIMGAIIAGIIYYFGITIPYLNIAETGIRKLIILLAIFTLGGAIVDSVIDPKH